MASSLKVSMVLLAYQQERFVRDAIQAIFSQEDQPSEVVLSDDCSQDATFRIIEEMAERYDGPADLIVRRNAENAGIAEHFNQVMLESSGDVIIVCAGDDVSLPRRVSLTRKNFESNRQLASLSLRQQPIDAAGNFLGRPTEVPPGSCKVFDFRRYLMGLTKHPSAASRAYRRDVFHSFGPLNRCCPSEDTPMLLRAMLVGEVQEIAEVGILYRRHSKNLSNPENVRKMELCEIKRQQRIDLDSAFQLGLINESRHQDYQRLLDVYWARRELSSMVRNQLLFGALNSVISESRLSVSERARYASRMLQRRFKTFLKG